MALAILEFIGENRGKVWFKIDTGSNPYYQVKIGKGISARDGNSWVDGVVHASQMAKNDGGGQLLGSSKTIGIPADQFDRNTAYVQLFSYKTPQGKSPAFSKVVKVPLGISVPELPYQLPRTLSIDTQMSTATFERPRRVACRTCKQEFSRQASVEDLLAGVLKLAAPAVLDVLTKGGSAPAGGSASDPASLIANILKAVLGAVGTPQPTPAVASAAAGGSKPMSIASDSRFSRPFIFGIDDALIASLAGPLLSNLAGPLVQALPQLLNAANQQRLQMKQEDNKLVSGILADINKRLMMDQLLASQKPAATAAPAPNPEELKKLLEMLAAAQAAQPNPPVATAKSLSIDPTSLSAKAVLAFDFGPPTSWQGASKILLAKGQPVQFNVKLTVGEPAPKAPLEKAIITVVIKDADHKQVAQKVFKQKAISANAPLALPFTAEELSKVPVNQAVSIVAEMRWMTSRGERKALGSSEVVFVNKYFVKEKGSSVSEEIELRDQNRFRAFWNKVWEAPTMDPTTNRGDNRKHHWELEVAAKYTVLLSSEHQNNGFMETKLLRAQPDPDSLTEQFSGKMKAGIELSLAELNKLTAIFDKATPLDPEKFEVINTPSFAKENSAEMTYPIKLRGKAGQRGMVWMIPTFRLFEIVLGSAKTIDANGQVTEIGEEKVRFPLPVSIRAIGVRSQ